MGVIGFLH